MANLPGLAKSGADIELTYVANADGTGYSEGDIIEGVYNPVTDTTTYYNSNTGLPVDPPVADITPKTPLVNDAELKYVFDTDTTTGEIVVAIQVLLFDCVGSFDRTYYIDNAGADYTPVGTVTCVEEGPTKVCLGSESVALTDAANAALTVPANATKATLTAYGDTLITFDGNDPATGAAHLFGDCRNGSIEGCELASLLARSVAATGTLYVSYSNC